MKTVKNTNKDFDFELEKKRFHYVALKNAPKYMFKYDDKNIQVISELLHYFNGISLENKLDLDKGIILAGGYGTGKTLLMKIFREYLYIKKTNEFPPEIREQNVEKRILNQKKFRPFPIKPVNKIVSDYSTKGDATLNPILYNETINAYGIAIAKPVTVCLDDFGRDIENVKFYGTDTEVIAKVLDIRYEIFCQGIKTHATTNYSTQELQEKYGERLYDRFKEMFNWVSLLGNSRRNERN